MSNQTERLEKLRQQKAQLEAKIKRVEAQEKAKAKKADTRRKILVGSYYLNMAEVENNMPELVQKMDGFLSRPSDRALFNLPPKK